MRSRYKFITVLAGAAVTAGVAAPAFAAPAAKAGTQPDLRASVAGNPFAKGTGQPVIDWNKALIGIQATPGAQPATVHPTRSFAILQAAEYDAVVSITHVGTPYKVTVRAHGRADATAAVDQAAHDVLAGLYPAQASVADSQLSTELATISAGAAKNNGIAVGQAVAKALLAKRANDGSAVTPPPFTPGTGPGQYRSTPPNFPTPVFTNWGNITPFVLRSGAQFRAAAPPPVTSAAYAKALAVVQSLGQNTSTTRKPDQTATGLFWGTAPIWNVWNQVAQEQVTAHDSSLAQATSAFANLDLALADTAIGLYDSKYHYQVWRPVTAIEDGATANNPGIVPNPNWLPLTNTAADPSYVGAHSGFSFAAATVLTAFFGARSAVTVNDGSPTTSRNFNSFFAAATQAALSRIYAGQHTPLDDLAGRKLGAQIGAFTIRDIGPIRTNPFGF